MNGWIQRFNFHFDQVSSGAEGTFFGAFGIDDQDARIDTLFIKPDLQSDQSLQDVFVSAEIFPSMAIPRFTPLYI